MFHPHGSFYSRYSQDKNVIGKFGSGTKYSVNMLLKAKEKFYIYCGNVCLDYYTKTINVNDGISSHDYDQVCCHISGKDENDKNINRKEDLGWTLQNGELDWDDMTMACREFLSNAIDRTIRQTGSYKDVVVQVVEENQVRAKKDHTRVFLPMTYDISKFYYSLDKRFLHFSSNYNDNKVLLEKKARSIDYEGSSVIYRKGIRVKEVYTYGKPSLYDYNLNDLKIDESRNASGSSVKSEIAKALLNASAGEKIKLLINLSSGEYYEKELASYDLFAPPEIKKLWKEAWEKAFSSIHVLSSGVYDTLIVSKGRKPVAVGTGWYTFLVACECPNEKTVLNDDDISGKVVHEATPAVMECLDRVWRFMVINNYTQGSNKPDARCFNVIQNGPKTYGYYKDGCVFIHDDYSGGMSINLLQTVLEEVTHHVTKATDCSRELQEFLFKVIVEKLLND